MKPRLKEIRTRLACASIALSFACLSLLAPSLAPAQAAPSPVAADGPPSSSGGIFPLSQVHRGLTAVAWTVFQGDKPEPMQVEILGILRGARGPGQDMILAQLHGARPEYTGVVAGMSGSPVYIGDKLLGALSYRIGEFAKDPIAGITPIEQMLEIRDLPIRDLPNGDLAGKSDAGAAEGPALGAPDPKPTTPGDQTFQAENFHAMETPLVMSGFQPAAIQFWQKQMAGTGLDMISAGGMGGSSQAGDKPPAAAPVVVPGSAVSALLVRGDLEISATCTVTYIDPRQLLACGHPIMQSGTISLPMTATDVVATLASPLNAFKIVNTGAPIGAFTEDRASGIRGVLGATPQMIPEHITVHTPQGDRKLNLEILDMPGLTPQAILVTLYDALLESNLSSDQMSYHLTGNIQLAGHSPSPLDLWATGGDPNPASLSLAFQAGERFNRIYTSDSRLGAIRSVDVQVEAIPRIIKVDLDSARIVSSDIVHAGDTVQVEVTLRPFQQRARNVRIPFTVPARLGTGTLRVLISDAGTLDRTLNQPHPNGRHTDLDSVLAQAGTIHSPVQVWVSVLVPETQAGMGGQTLASLPLSVANALEPMHSSQDISLNGESAQVEAQAPAGGLLNGFQVLNLTVQPGGGLH